MQESMYQRCNLRDWSSFDLGKVLGGKGNINEGKKPSEQDVPAKESRQVQVGTPDVTTQLPL